MPVDPEDVGEQVAHVPAGAPGDVGTEVGRPGEQRLELGVERREVVVRGEPGAVDARLLLGLLHTAMLGG